jgi:hypothetical protein
MYLRLYSAKLYNNILYGIVNYVERSGSGLTEILFQQICKLTEEDHEIAAAGKLVSWHKSGTVVSRIQVACMSQVLLLDGTCSGFVE